MMISLLRLASVFLLVDLVQCQQQQQGSEEEVLCPSVGIYIGKNDISGVGGVFRCKKYNGMGCSSQILGDQIASGCAYKTELECNTDNRTCYVDGEEMIASILPPKYKNSGMCLQGALTIGSDEVHDLEYCAGQQNPNCVWYRMKCSMAAVFFDKQVCIDDDDYYDYPVGCEYITVDHYILGIINFTDIPCNDVGKAKIEEDLDPNLYQVSNFGCCTGDRCVIEWPQDNTIDNNNTSQGTQTSTAAVASSYAFIALCCIVSIANTVFANY